ncbi:MAG: hypothetical protein U0Q15_14515 [Kineosporiaceae bacterium]
MPGTRAALTATVITEQGPVGLVLAHASRPARPGLSLSDSEDWADDLHDIAVAAAAVRGPKLLVGDLQAGPWHADYRRLEATSGMDDAADALGRGLRPTWPSWNGLAINPLDHVLIGGGVRVRYVGTASVGGSAHLALVTEVTVPAAPRG